MSCFKDKAEEIVAACQGQEELKRVIEKELRRVYHAGIQKALGEAQEVIRLAGLTLIKGKDGNGNGDGSEG